MIKKKLNCWEFMRCEREPGGKKAESLGICPAAGDQSFKGINDGDCGGRFCWAVSGTFCNGQPQGTFAEKRASCMECEFYKQVREEEGNADKSTKFLRYIIDESGRPLYDRMTYAFIKAGERFVEQGAMEDTAYIIQRGSCIVIVEKEGELYPANHCGVGDIVGGLGILTGEPRRAHVEAESDMEVWVLRRKDFEDLSARNPGILTFLTELVADRFDSRRPTAYRSIGKYVCTDIIGRGAFSIVYKGIHKGLNMPVAIKMMRHDMAMNPEFLSGFHNEAKTIAGLNHENIVKIYDIEELYRTVFIVMEHVAGTSLKAMITNLKKIPPGLAIHFLSQICAALSYAHGKQIIHRDINPTNMIVKANDQLKILDFGLSCPIGTEDFSNSGTAFYMAPEQIEGDPVDSRTDIYAMGICAFEMVTGIKPYQHADLNTLLKMHLKGNLPDPAEFTPEIPELLRQFIMKAAHRDPGQRYLSAGQAFEALRPLLERYQTVYTENAAEKRKIAGLYCVYSQEHELALTRLMEDFYAKAEALGVEVRVAEFKDRL
jgi:tRNA A-37 threonylcarbamoyl transferase component Bud32